MQLILLVNLNYLKDFRQAAKNAKTQKELSETRFT
jgi:hypothetical protein